MERRTPSLEGKPVEAPTLGEPGFVQAEPPPLEIPAALRESPQPARRAPRLEDGSAAPLTPRKPFWGWRKPRAAPRATSSDGLIVPPRAPTQRREVSGNGGGFGFHHVISGLVLVLLAVTVLPVVLLRVVPAYTSSFMLHYQFERLTSERKMPALSQEWVPWEDISPQIKLAVIAAEDQKFPEHSGLDFEAIEKAVEHNKRSRRKRGASTISQQVAKNLFLSSTRSMTRKGVELGYTLMIEWMWPKRRILEVYLNIAEFGEGVYGVEAAAQRYFGKPAAKLTSYEAALMAAVLPNPKRLKLAAPSGYVHGRASSIQGQMYRLGTGYLKDL